jgi:heterodisulfide reductase subunit C
MSIQQILFTIITIFAFGWAFVQFKNIRSKIFLGKEESIKGNSSKRWRNVLLVAFGQQKMFKRWIPALFHLFIYVAFLLTQVELIEILIDGIFGKHRFFANSLGGFYTFLISFIELLSLLALVATLVFLARRLILKVARFEKAEMIGWPKLDGILILFGELLLITGIFTMNGADTVLQSLDPSHYPNTGNLLVSQFTGPLFFGELDVSTLHFLERTGWWLHIVIVYAFLNYLPSSKHLHIILAFPNVFYSNLKSRGEMENMPEVMNEVKSMLGLTPEGEADMPMEEELPEFGAKDIFDLSWKNVLDAFTCTECGRCTDNCPANLTGKKLSPRKIMMDIRDRTEEVYKKIKSGDIQYINNGNQGEETVLAKANFDDGKSLFDYISKEEIHACTTCNACVEACPVMINPMDPILQLRRYEILTESAGPADWLPMFNALENGGAVWQMPESRDAWIKN